MRRQVRRMLTLCLLRHAKSSRDDPALDDFDRPLASRGMLAAPAMGRRMAVLGLNPDLVLCSSSARTRKTLELSLAEMQLNALPRVVFDDGLYLATPSMLLERLRRAGTGRDQPRRVLLIGHNPGMHALALSLIGTGDAAPITALARKFPTAGLAVITFQLKAWSEVRPALGHLALFEPPPRQP